MPPPSWLSDALESRAYDSEHSPAARELAQREYLRDLARQGITLSGDEEASRNRADAYSVYAGKEHPDKNRYEDVLPYDRTRVALKAGRYINASWVRELHGRTLWIAQQAPMRKPNNTMFEFFSMLIESAYEDTPGGVIQTVIQLSPYKEGSTSKACQYIPKLHQTDTFYESIAPSAGPRILLTASHRKEIKHAKCIEHGVTIIHYDSVLGPSMRGPFLFNHLHYTGWADKGVPADRASLLAFINYVHEQNRRYNTRPVMVVGCSAGVGRTGTFLALCSLLRVHGLILGEPAVAAANANLQEDDIPPSALDPPKNEFDDVMKEIDALREQRPMMVETEEQHKFIYETLKVALESREAGVVPVAGAVLSPSSVIRKIFPKRT